MKNIRNCVYVLALLVLTSGVAKGQATRTWVSGVGDDANPCSRTAPCKTFAGAIAKTAPGGEIDALDPGGFGALTITKAITIDGGGGQVASVLVAGTNGIVVAAGASDSVTIRNLGINGLTGNGGSSGLNGIRFLSGAALHIQHCYIFGFSQNGIDLEPGANGGLVSVVDTTVTDSVMNGLYAIGTGGRLSVTIDRCRFEHNNNGVLAADFTRVTVRDSDASENAAVGFLAEANAGDVIINIANSTAGNNVATGIQAGGGATLSVVRLSSVSIFSNFTNGMVVGTNGSIVSFGNNYNTGNGAPSSTIAPQ